ncbi:glucose/arabinose dehydrogenase [Undibacterium sp. GrIS 1.2]|uniref:PQQ-dependent sugar dehydrogenase n=2 Tax=Undibacterium TaxID=401469 RepID=UPI0034913CD1
MRHTKIVTPFFLLISFFGGESVLSQTVNDMARMGSNPTLPKPQKQLIPTVNIAPAIGWPLGMKPVAPPGFSVTAFSVNLDHPRWLYVLPNGDVLVAETNAPPKPDDSKGIKGFVMKKVMKKAGAGVASANRITLLRGINKEGVAEIKTAFLEGLNSPFGMALVGEDLYIADTDAVLRFPYKEGDTKITSKPVKIADLPAGTINHHWTKNIIASRDGTRLYVSVGSNSNVGENGIEAETNRADILEITIKTGAVRVFASGLRNPVGMAWQPENGSLWTAVNERDELGDDLVPDYMTSVKDGAFYGWPYCYFGQNIDTRVTPQRPDLVESAIKPDFALGAHTASLGLTFYDANLFSPHYKNGAFIGQHGSWNRKLHSGYKVIFVPFVNGQPTGAVEDFLTGFLSRNHEAYGRPVGVAVDKKGALLVADDVGNVIWRINK